MGRGIWTFWQYLTDAGACFRDSLGLLHLFYTCVCMMFWRVFLRLSYRCPAHLKFSLTVERWTQLVGWSKECIEWLDGHEECFDSWMFVAYAASSCALVQVGNFFPLPQAAKPCSVLAAPGAIVGLPSRDSGAV